MDSPRQAVLIFELGHLQVFCYQTLEEYSMRTAPKEIFWQKKGEPIVHGPFSSAYEAVNDYSEFIKPQEKSSNVIPVDFRNKKRIK